VKAWSTRAPGRVSPAALLKRAALLAVLVWGTLGPPPAVLAQSAPKAAARIGYLAFNMGGDPRAREAFLQGLRELGHVEGRNLVIEYRDAQGKPERFPALAAELVALRVDVIVSTGGTAGALAAKRATTALPIIFTGVGDPVRDGLVASLAQPGGNVTGLSLAATDLVGKWMELLKQAVPGAARIAFLMKPDAMPDTTRKDYVKAADAAARALGVQLQVVEARGPQEFDRAFSSMTRVRAGGLMVLATPVYENERRRLADLALKNRLPAVFSLPTFVEAGGLMSYGANLPDLFRRTAGYVDKILKGTKPGDLPVEEPTKFDLVINLKTARALGLTMPQSLLGRADQVIE